MQATTQVAAPGMGGSHGAGAVKGRRRAPSASTATWSATCASNQPSTTSGAKPSALRSSIDLQATTAPSLSRAAAKSAADGSSRVGNPPVLPPPMRVVVVSSLRPGSPRPKANSRVVLPPPPTRATSDRGPGAKAAANPSTPVTIAPIVGMPGGGGARCL